MRAASVSVVVVAWLIVACRGREYLQPMRPFTGTLSESLLVFSTDDEQRHGAPRIHLIEPADGAASELTSGAESPLAELIGQRHITYADRLVAADGRQALLTGERARHHIEAVLSPDQKSVLVREIGKVRVLSLSHDVVGGPADELAECDWLSAGEILCLAGKYQERRKIVKLDAKLKAPAVLYELQGKTKLGNLVVSRDKKTAAFTANLADHVEIFRMDLAARQQTQVAAFDGRYIFSLALSHRGDIAARTVASKHEGDRLNPYDVWISGPFGPATGAGFLLNLPALDSPGFFSGKGFRGVEHMAFSPDGNRLALLMSRENDCRMADEGGNLACRQNIFVAERDKPQLRQLTQFRMTSARNLQWLQFQR